MKILLTAFEPFDGLPTNSSLEVFKRINRENIIKKELPVSYERVKILLNKYIEEYKPDLVISLGQAGGEKKIRVEKVGLNYTRASIKDNDGDFRSKGEVVQNGPKALFSNIDLENIVDNAKNDNVDCYLSLSAGGYICNTTYYYSLFKNNSNAVFIHYPFYDGQVGSNNNTVNLEKLVDETNYLIDKIENNFIL